MNLYLRYFSEETLVHSVDEAVNFLTSLSDFRVDENMINDLRQFAESSVSYPKRYKIRPRVYFIVIKTTANTMEEFKANNKKNATATDSTNEAAAPHKNDKQAELAEEKKGWYEGSIMFKRVIPIPRHFVRGTLQSQQRNTLLRTYCSAFAQPAGRRLAQPVSFGQREKLFLQIPRRTTSRITREIVTIKNQVPMINIFIGTCFISA